jgi:hypothetical protein
LNNRNQIIKIRNLFATIVVLLFIVSCSSKFLKKENSDQLLHNDEYDKAVRVSSVEANGPSGRYVKLSSEDYKDLYPKKIKVKIVIRKPKKIMTSVLPESREPRPAETKSLASRAPHLPAFEDGQNFDGRRPIIDPFHVGEKVSYEVSYFGIVAGELNMEVLPFVNVNGRKSYHFKASGQTATVFDMFYAVDDWLETFVDYEKLVPVSYALHVKESKQLRETRCFFNWDTLTGNYSDKRITKEDGIEEKKFEWKILEYSQNVFSAPFYMRTFDLSPGKKLVYRLAHEKENILLTGTIIRKEKLETPAGTFDTVVVKPHIEIGGVFKPIGDIFIWLTDDDRKFIVRIESKIKIGKIIASVKHIDLGEGSVQGPTQSPESPEDPEPKSGIGKSKSVKNIPAILSRQPASASPH